jgi:hypothetical protein
MDCFPKAPNLDLLPNDTWNDINPFQQTIWAMPHGLKNMGQCSFGCLRVREFFGKIQINIITY